MMHIDGFNELSKEQQECIVFSQTCMDRDFHTACANLKNARYKILHYVKSNADSLPSCVDAYDKGSYSAEDLRDILMGCYEDFQYIFSVLDKACERNEDTAIDFHEYRLTF